MKSMLALIKREYLEHRGAFLYAPAVVVTLMALALAAALLLGRVRLPFDVDVAATQKFLELAFLGLGFLWFFYLAVALFFYYADAFSADRRNNAMFFWKSMPVSDFKILSSKMLAGMTLLPALIFLAMIAGSVLLYLLTAIGALMLPRLTLPPVGDVLATGLNLGAFSLVYLVMALLWYAPFFAWVGALSTVFRRWSIPLAFLIPGLIGLVENLFLGGTGPRVGYFLEFLRQRVRFGFDHFEVDSVVMQGQGADAGYMISRLFAVIDWPQLAGGLIFTALAVYAASEYRRRVIST
jgi:ABC-2 type transport system permease protein